MEDLCRGVVYLTVLCGHIPSLFPCFFVLCCPYILLHFKCFFNLVITMIQLILMDAIIMEYTLWGRVS